MILGIYSANRSQGANWTLITEKDTKHSPNNSKDLSISFFESIMTKRLKDNKLVEINSDNPILGFPKRKTAGLTWRSAPTQRLGRSLDDHLP